jgi:hypothetical protein
MHQTRFDNQSEITGQIKIAKTIVFQPFWRFYALLLLKSGIKLLLSGLKQQPLDILEKAGIVEILGKENLFEFFEDALKHAEIISPKSNA